MMWSAVHGGAPPARLALARRILSPAIDFGACRAKAFAPEANAAVATGLILANIASRTSPAPGRIASGEALRRDRPQ